MLKKGNSAVIKNNNISFENYRHVVRHTDLQHKLQTQSEHIQQSLVRYSLIDFLCGNTADKFYWDYWLVVTFGYAPQKDLCENTLRASHFHFDRWLLTNNKLTSIPVDVRSKWVCCPEKGNEGHLHYNCFLQLPIKPQVKTYQNEWDTIRVTLKRIFKNLEKELPNNGKIAFEIYERKRKKDVLRQAIYSTQEMRQQWMNDNFSDDHFANTILSWKDWGVIPINRRTPKKKQLITIAREGALEQFMS